MSSYRYWLDALAGKNPPIVNEDPQPGFYRMKRNGGWLPVAVWPRSETRLGFKINHEIVDEPVGVERWPWYSSHPITEAEYRKVAERGENWSDSDPIVSEMTANVVRAGMKAMEDANPVIKFREQIDEAVAGTDAYEEIESDEADVRALSLRNMLNELASNADKAREAEKAPHLKASRDVDAKWQPMIKTARDGAGRIKVARDTWADDKRKAAATAAAATQAAQEAEQRAAAAEERSAQPVAPMPSNLPPPAAQVRPTYGRASPTGTKMVVIAVDYDKFFAAIKTRPEWTTVKAQFDEWAQKLASKGIIADGVTAEERANTR